MAAVPHGLMFLIDKGADFIPQCGLVAAARTLDSSRGAWEGPLVHCPTVWTVLSRHSLGDSQGVAGGLDDRIDPQQLDDVMRGCRQQRCKVGEAAHADRALERLLLTP